MGIEENAIKIGRQQVIGSSYFVKVSMTMTSAISEPNPVGKVLATVEATKRHPIRIQARPSLASLNHTRLLIQYGRL